MIHPISSSRQSFHRQLTCCRRIEGDLALARVQKAMREGAAREWRLMRQIVVLMVPRVQRGVVEGRLETREEGHGARIWSGRIDGGG